MKQELFYVAHAGEQSGPFSLDDIFAKIEAKKLDLNDYLYDEASQDWVVLMAYPALSDKMKSMKPSAPPKAAKEDAPAPPEKDAIEWFVLKGENKFGPFTVLDIVKMLQDKSVFEFDYVWHVGLKAWKRIAEAEEFSPDAIRNLKNSKLPDLTEVFFRRRHARVQHGASILVHDNKTVWKGKSVEVSSGGAGIVVENALLQPGQIVHLHFKPGDGLPPFNASCEVISKKFSQVSSQHAPVQYGVKFVHLNTQAQKDIKELTARKKKAA
ncbi:MAG: PilZ domain-containing protein [Bdellovibrionaceae bacterium]|nr:PilZ domain-containing protein [Pseudobdellovibrionaceae bacterium]